MKKTAPKVSVVVPAYNEENYISKTISSLKTQDYKGIYEIVVVDNGSTDKTAEIARKSGVTVIEEPTIGVCSARQAGASVSQGSIIISTDGDTSFPSDWISTIVKTFESDQSIVGVTGPYKYVNPPLWGRVYCFLLFGTVNAVFKLTKKVFYSPASNLAFQKAAWEKSGGYNTTLTQGGDEHDLLRRLKRQGKIAYLKDNSVNTSSRRLKYGLFYNLFITLGLYYVFGYVSSRITGKQIIGSYPAHRTEQVSGGVTALKLVGSLVLITMVLYTYTFMHTYIQSHSALIHIFSRSL